MSVISSIEKLQIRGLPGEEQKMLVIFATHEHPLGSRPISLPGQFKVQFLLARPSRLLFPEEAPSFVTNVVGDSHLGIGAPKPGKEHTDDITGMVLDIHFEGRVHRFKCIPNEKGYMGKIQVDDIVAKDYADAESIAYRALSPFLSAWSVTMDIPLMFETIQVTDLTTHTDMLRVRAPHIAMKPAGGVGTFLSDEFCQYASLYREGMNANTPLYRFLCFYKIVESLYIRRSDKAKEAKSRGEEPRKYNEDVPLTVDAVKGLISMLYPWRQGWDDDFTIDQLLPSDAHGKRFRKIREQELKPLRDRIAHALMHSGRIETVADRLEDINAVTKWLPILRVWVRLLLRIEFPGEFQTRPIM